MCTKKWKIRRCRNYKLILFLLCHKTLFVWKPSTKVYTKRITLYIRFPYTFPLQFTVVHSTVIIITLLCCNFLFIIQETNIKRSKFSAGEKNKYIYMNIFKKPLKIFLTPKRNVNQFIICIVVKIYRKKIIYYPQAPRLCWLKIADTD